MVRTTGISGVNERLRSAINVSKQDKVEQILNILKSEVLTALKSYMEILDGNMTADVESDGEMGYKFTFTAKADTLLSVGIAASMLD